DHLDPALDSANTRNLRDLVRLAAVPFLPRTSCRIARFEHEMPAGPQSVMKAAQGRLPIRRVRDGLRNVPGHGGKVYLHRGQILRGAVDPSHTFAARLGSRDIE